MAELVRRLQILIDEERFARLERASRRSGAPVSTLVRSAIDQVFPPEVPDRDAAVARLLAAELMPVDDWEVMKRETRDELSAPES